MEFPIEERDTADKPVCRQPAAAAVVRPQSPELVPVRKTHRSVTLDGGLEGSRIGRSVRRPSTGFSLS
jgi:hypothetical protein